MSRAQYKAAKSLHTISAIIFASDSTKKGSMNNAQHLINIAVGLKLGELYHKLAIELFKDEPDGNKLVKLGNEITKLQKKEEEPNMLSVRVYDIEVFYDTHPSVSAVSPVYENEMILKVPVTTIISQDTLRSKVIDELYARTAWNAPDEPGFTIEGVDFEYEVLKDE